MQNATEPILHWTIYFPPSVGMQPGRIWVGTDIFRFRFRFTTAISGIGTGSDTEPSPWFRLQCLVPELVPILIKKKKKKKKKLRL